MSRENKSNGSLREGGSQAKVALLHKPLEQICQFEYLGCYIMYEYDTLGEKLFTFKLCNRKSLGTKSAYDNFLP